MTMLSPLKVTRVLSMRQGSSMLRTRSMPVLRAKGMPAWSGSGPAEMGRTVTATVTDSIAEEGFGMQVEKNKVVTFLYRMSEPVGAAIEDSLEGQPAVYLHGLLGVLTGLEDAMAGKQAGDRFSVTLSPEKAYGARRSDAVQRVSIKHVMTRGNKKETLQPGKVVQVNTHQGPRDVTVIKAGLKTVDVDTNHPFAGKTLSFDIEVVDVRDATTDELAHGHAHGAGGHEH